jgi:hypothetical protein
VGLASRGDGIERDAKKWEPVFRTIKRQTKTLAQNDDSGLSHFALVSSDDRRSFIQMPRADAYKWRSQVNAGENPRRR